MATDRFMAAVSGILLMLLVVLLVYGWELCRP